MPFISISTSLNNYGFSNNEMGRVGENVITRLMEKIGAQLQSNMVEIMTQLSLEQLSVNHTTELT